MRAWGSQIPASEITGCRTGDSRARGRGSGSRYLRAESKTSTIAWLTAIALLSPLGAAAQSIEELKRQLKEKDAEIERLRERVVILEEDATPRRLEDTKQAPEPAASDEGSEDEEDITRALERALVRERGSLLPFRFFEVEPNFVYSHFNSDDLRRDAFGPGMAARAGLPWKSQFDISVPYVFEHRSGAVSNEANGVGDVSVGVSHQLLREQEFVPDLIIGANYQVATGENTAFESANPVVLGAGFDSIDGSLTAVKRIDPLVFFGSYTFTHVFPEDKSGLDVDPGNVNAVRFGTILATGPNTSLRMAFNLTFFEELEIDNTDIPGSDDPLGIIEFGGSIALNDAMALDVLVGAGVTRNAPDFRVTAALPTRF
jgi:hypothetical protein